MQCIACEQKTKSDWKVSYLRVQACAAGPAALVLRDGGQDIAPLFAGLAGALHASARFLAGLAVPLLFVMGTACLLVDSVQA